MSVGERATLDAELEARLTFRWSDLPPVTGDLVGTGGALRIDPDDFAVRELPAYLPSGEGSHAYARVEKVGHTTRDLLLALADAGVPEANVGVAGLKDKVARTEQWLSVPRRFEEVAWPALEALEGVTVLETSRHRNKLGIGHLRGNAFSIRIRDIVSARRADGSALRADPTPGDSDPSGGSPDPSAWTAEAAADAARAVLARLARDGSPNYFGPQRFGRFGRNAVDGWRLVHGESVPGGHRLKRFFVSALQSQLFNRWLAERVVDGSYTGVVVGDWARKHDTGGTFEVGEDELADAQARAAALAISATLPLYGKKVRPSAAEAGRREAAGLAALGLRWSDLVGRHGDRRLTRIAGLAADVEVAGDDLLLRFDLPKGSYATVVLREVMKVEVDAPVDGALIDGATTGGVPPVTSQA